MTKKFPEAPELNYSVVDFFSPTNTSCPQSFLPVYNVPIDSCAEYFLVSEIGKKLNFDAILLQ
jgi:hypothetical protein